MGYTAAEEGWKASIASIVHDKMAHLRLANSWSKAQKGMVTTLQPEEWLRKVEEARLLCLLSIPHFLQPPITILVIRQLLYLVHNGYLWIDNPVHITA